MGGQQKIYGWCVVMVAVASGVQQFCANILVHGAWCKPGVSVVRVSREVLCIVCTGVRCQLSCNHNPQQRKGVVQKLPSHFISEPSVNGEKGEGL